jgi:hypothetical protein
MEAAQRSINERISEIDQQAAKIVKMQKALSEFMEDVTAGSTQLRDKLIDLKDTIAGWVYTRRLPQLHWLAWMRTANVGCRILFWLVTNRRALFPKGWVSVS